MVETEKNTEIKKICKNCKVEFMTKIITTKKTRQWLVNDKIKNPDHIVETKTDIFTKPQFTKCKLCRSLQKTLNFINGVM
tara:strand:- start:3836 stop:4075 length:240 start_codon:yes stop_codon:yes gene_type:complete